MNCVDMFDCVLFLVWNTEDLDTLKDTFKEKRGESVILLRKKKISVTGRVL